MGRATPAAKGMPRQRFAVAGLGAFVPAGILNDDERIDLTGGEVVPMPPELPLLTRQLFR
ncbi:MAG: hypothetical protein ACLPPF_01165 [Rhodomicrobium sp.]